MHCWEKVDQCALQKQRLKTFAGSGSMLNVDAKAKKHPPGSAPGHVRKSVDVSVVSFFGREKCFAADASVPTTQTKAGKTAADIGSMCIIDTKAEKKYPGTQKTPPGSMPVNSEAESIKVTDSLKARPFGSMTATVAVDNSGSATAPEGKLSEDDTSEQPTTASAIATETTTTTTKVSTTIITTTTTTTTTTTIPPWQDTYLHWLDKLGHTFDWLEVEPFKTPLHFASSRTEYPYGNLAMKCVHDTESISFLFEVPGPLHFDPDNDHQCPSLLIMFKIWIDTQIWATAPLWRKLVLRVPQIARTTSRLQQIWEWALDYFNQGNNDSNY
ncbi:hypothetical protein HJC23_006241 [Cyclotella cryptica]|uniref:Uncharacterized protein n=1 Tax=Cyclotella cryptica TaxID=29204 RepID=A0ABD3PXP6_9STRA